MTGKDPEEVTVQKVPVTIDLDDRKYRHLQSEAERRGVTVESLVQQMVQGLLREMEQEEREGTDHIIIPG
jgi:hypothetical protein